jgi:hypothetical protein
MTTTTTAPGLTRHAWAAAQALAAALRARLTTPLTDRRGRRPPCEYPPRCAARHGYPFGEHRSQHLSWHTPYGGLIATRVQTITGVGHLQLCATVRLPADEDTARWQAQHLSVGIDLVIRAITAEPPPPTTPTNAAAALPAARPVPAQARPAVPARGPAHPVRRAA